MAPFEAKMEVALVVHHAERLRGDRARVRRNRRFESTRPRSDRSRATCRSRAPILDTVLQSDLTTSEAVFASPATSRPRRQNSAPERNRSSGEIAHLGRPPVASAAGADRPHRRYPGSPWSGAANQGVIRSVFHAYNERAKGLPRTCLGSTVCVDGFE